MLELTRIAFQARRCLDVLVLLSLISIPRNRVQTSGDEEDFPIKGRDVLFWVEIHILLEIRHVND